jgi:hypothetical protein
MPEQAREPCTLKALALVPVMAGQKARSAVFLPDVPAIHVFCTIPPARDAPSDTMR